MYLFLTSAVPIYYDCINANIKNIYFCVNKKLANMMEDE